MVMKLSLNEEATRALVQWANKIRREENTAFAASRHLATRLGAHYKDGLAEIGFWAPELIQYNISSEHVYLEVFRAQESLDFRADMQTIRFQCRRVPLILDGEYLWGVIEGMRPGSRNGSGDFYQVIYTNDNSQSHSIPDYLAYSLPFGSFAPAEFYDVARVQSQRADRDYFAKLDFDPRFERDGIPRIATPMNILQIHVNTASPSGTLEGLTKRYTEIAKKIENKSPLTPTEQAYIGYDAIQLMPIHPTIEYESGAQFWNIVNDTVDGDTVTINLRQPDMTNWGYDILMSAMCAINPTALGSKRPDELVDFIATLHNFPGKPIKVIFDVVYGHIDNQALPLLNKRFFADANMYGQNVNFKDPVVRALLLEMQRRNHNFGVDGVRVDGAQDFKNWNPDKQIMEHDDDYLREMNDIVQEIAGTKYRPWMIFEDGRPWPRDDWELASTYREVTKQFPNVFQWGPLTFAHNTPFLFTFWVSKWWRIREIASVGKNWITGCANHDTLRRGTQVPTDARINTYLGKELPEIFRKAYDNPASKLFDYVMMPGIPMDFINASLQTPWGFIRNTDDRYGVKVVAEEARFLYWILNDDLFAHPTTFPRLKRMGFNELDGLRRFMTTLADVVHATDYKLSAIAAMMNATTPKLIGPDLDIPTLKQIARAWMDDVHELCNVSRYSDRVDQKQAEFMLAVRNFRRDRPWLADNLGMNDTFDYVYPTDSTALFFGERISPDSSERLLFLANMEGSPRTIIPEDLPIPHIKSHSWHVALQTPGLNVDAINDYLTLKDSEGVVFIASTPTSSQGE